jgi:hypothetical protein
MRSVLLALVVVCLASSMATAAEPVFAEFFSSTREVRVVGDRAYAVAQAGLVIYDVSDRANPRKLSNLFLDRSGSFKLEVAGDYVYVLSGQIVFEEAILRVVDVSDPLAPHVVGEYTDLADSRVQGMLVVGSTLVLANGSAIELVDVSDPASPTRAASLPILVEPDQIVGLAASGSTVYAAWQSYTGEVPTGGMTAVDVSDPSAPKQLGVHTIEATPVTVAAVGDTVYVGQTPPAALVLDASDPAAIEEVGRLEYTFAPQADVYAKGNRLFVGTMVGDSPAVAVKVYDVSTPTSPVLLGETTTNCQVVGMEFDAARSDAFLPCAEAIGSGMSIMDVTAGGELELIDNVIVAQINDVEVAGGTTFLAGGDGLYAIRGSDAGGVDLVGWTSLPLPARRMQIVGTRAYVLTAENTIGINSRIHVVDVTSPSGMTVLGSLALEDNFHIVTSNRFHVVGETIYVATPGGLEIYDASDPSSIERIGAYATPDFADNVIVDGNFAYLTTLRYEDELQRVDLYVLKVKKPARPKLAGRLRIVDTASYGNDLAVANGRLYLGVAGPGAPFPHAGDGRLVIVDVRKPAKPRVRSKIYTTPTFNGYAREIAVVGDVAYVADGLDGISVISVADDRAPEYLRAIDTPGFTPGVWVDAAGSVTVADETSVQFYLQ